VLPYTPMYELYREVNKLSRKARRDRANRLAEDATELVNAFAESVTSFSTYRNIEEPFLPTTARKGLPEPPPSSINRTEDLVAWLAHANRCDVPGWPHLSFDYVEREVSVVRTTEKARFAGHPELSAGRALVPDLLLVNRQDRMPIVAEVKITKGQQPDKDPFAALIQCLTGLAHLATAHQYERLLRHFGDAHFRELDGEPPVMDAYLVLVDFDPTLTSMKALMESTKRLSCGLTQHEAFRRNVRRITCLDLAPRHGSLRACLHWTTS